MSRIPARPAARGLSPALLLAALLLSGCTGDSDAAPAPAPPPVPASAATTPVPAPTPGTAVSSVESQPVRKRKPVPLDAAGRAADEVTVRLTAVEAVEAKASGPGEVAGPALAITVEVENGTSQALDLGSAVVNLSDAAGAPGALMSADPARPLPAEVRAGAQVSGVYVFTVAEARRDPVTVEVGVTPSDALVVFRGQPAG